MAARSRGAAQTGSGLFSPGIAYSKTMLRYFLSQDERKLVATAGGKIVDSCLSEENPPLAHIITLDVAESTAGTEWERRWYARAKRI